MVDSAWKKAKCFSLLKIYVEVPSFSCFQSVFQRQRERERVRFNKFCGHPLSLRCFWNSFSLFWKISFEVLPGKCGAQYNKYSLVLKSRLFLQSLKMGSGTPKISLSPRSWTSTLCPWGKYWQNHFKTFRLLSLPAPFLLNSTWIMLIWTSCVMPLNPLNLTKLLDFIS